MNQNNFVIGLVFIVCLVGFIVAGDSVSGPPGGVIFVANLDDCPDNWVVWTLPAQWAGPARSG
jgi:hypothetical protein